MVSSDSAATEPIDVSSIAAIGSHSRSLVKVASIDAAALEVWSAWTSDEGLAQWWGPAATNIELRIGGPFEILFSLEAPEGERGSETCRILAYVPGEMFSFTWNAPPHLALRSTHTWVVLTFSQTTENQTSLRLVHTGFLEGPDWDEYLEYFDSAWAAVLERCVAHWKVGS